MILHNCIFKDEANSQELETNIQHANQIFRLYNDGSLKPFWLSLMGNEVYCYQKNPTSDGFESKHKSMHTLCDTFVQADTE